MIRIPQSSKILKIEAVNKGWSMDEKYYIETVNQEKWLLRLSDKNQFDRKKAEFEAIEQVAKLGFKMSQPIDFGMGKKDQEEKVYSLFAWVEGQDAEVVLPSLSEQRQYELGKEAGQILRQIHSVESPVTILNWEERYNRKIDHKIDLYKNCGIKMAGEEAMLQFIENHRYLLKDRPQVLQHGDFHVGNLLITPDEQIGVIDFNRYDYGDPWEEFNRIVFSVRVSEHFSTGMIDGYFDNNIPEDFMSLMTLYIATNAVSSLPWAIPFGEQEIKVMQENIASILKHYQNFTQRVPTWYKD
jgi:aminoglycoside phosphotransferase (APT) family kinase protein